MTRSPLELGWHREVSLAGYEFIGRDALLAEKDRRQIAASFGTPTTSSIFSHRYSAKAIVYSPWKCRAPSCGMRLIR
jgi:hypothetical protein